LIFKETNLAGVYKVEPECIVDERGFFARTFCETEFTKQGLVARLVQCSVSRNIKRGILRGIHYQIAPHSEVKLVRCTMGAIFDIVVDLRRNSLTYTQWTSAELTAENQTALYIPEGCAHGFLTLTDNSEVFYQMSAFYEPSAGSGVRWNDPAFNIRLPFEPEIIAARDQQYADYCP
jgi:dTDP-4-dehydrorhamnose 3,5-epimerase